MMHYAIDLDSFCSVRNVRDVERFFSSPFFNRLNHRIRKSEIEKHKQTTKKKTYQPRLKRHNNKPVKIEFRNSDGLD